MGSPAEGTESNKWGIKLREKVMSNKIVAFLTGRSMLAKAERGLLGERMLTWTMKRMRSLSAELLPSELHPGSISVVDKYYE